MVVSILTCTAIRADEALMARGSALYVEAPMNSMPKGAKWSAIIRALSP